MNEQTSPDESEQVLADAIDNAVPTMGYELLPLVGIGGSAGSLAALHSFLQALPAHSGLAYVVMLQLPPEAAGTVAQTLQASTAMPVHQLGDTCKVERDHVYVIAPGKGLRTYGGHLRLVELPARKHQRMAIDLFFRSLADSHGPHAAAVVLSGGNGDGTVGIRRLKERGGLTIAQDPGEAECADMPRAAIATGMVDWVLPTAGMPEQVLAYFRMEARLQLPAEPDPGANEPPADAEIALQEILGFVHERTGRNLGYYKRSTILRRIGRRMQVNGVEDLPAYLACLRTRSGETGAFLQDLLVSVTNFFRDSACFERFEAQLKPLLQGKGSADTVRIWTAACATGEEAYSIAILLSEYAGTVESPPIFQIFATDLDEGAIATARNAFYPAAIEADVSDDRLARYFTQEAGGYRVRREIREMVLFVVHDLLADAPFSRMDVVTCRNLLIYLQREAQAQVINAFHFAMQPGGCLFLGASETVEESNPFFAPLDKDSRIYRSLPGARTHLSAAGQQGVQALALEAQRRARAGPVIASDVFRAPLRPLAPPQGADALALDPGEPIDTGSRLAGPAYLHLQKDVERLHLLLHETAEQHAVSMEEFKANFEELQAINEELRSATEELETSREELQSINEELTTVNQELKNKIDEVGQSNSDMQNLMDATAIATIFLNRELRIKRYTPTADQLFSLIATDLGRPLSDLTTTLDYPELAADAIGVLETLVPVEREVRRNDSHWFLARARPYRTLNHRIAGIVLTFVDITERKREQEALRLSQERFSVIVNQTTAGVVQLSLEGSVEFANQSYQSMTGYSFEELSPMSLFSLVHPDDRALFKAFLSRLSERGEPFQMEKRCVRKDGTVIWTSNNVSRISFGADGAGSALLMSTDITERKRADDALSRSEERLRLIVENAVDFAIFSTDPEGLITRWNVGAERLLGYTETEVLGRSADIIFTPDDRAAGAPQEEMEQARFRGRAADNRFHMRKDGSMFWASGALMPMLVNGLFVGFVKILRDQTGEQRARGELERSRAELVEALQQKEFAHAELEMADVAKDRFLAVLSHELRNPLASIHSVAQAMRSEQLDEPERRHAIDILGRQAQAMKSLLDDLLDISRLRLGRLVLHRQQVRLADIFQGAVEAVQPAIEAAGHHLRIEPPPADLTVFADPVRLGQVLTNLLSNAAKYTAPGGHISLLAERVGSHLNLAVTDDGVGMAPDRVESMFGMFVQEAADQPGTAGLGIGLALVRNIVELHGGTVAGSSPGEGLGCRFVVSLPLPVAPESQRNEAAQRNRSDSPGALNGTVLIADDNADALWSMSMLLRASGCVVQTVSGGIAAIQAARQSMPDVAILDVGMPDLIGHEVARQIRSLPGGTEVLLIAATGWGQEADRLAASSAGFDIHLVKPVDLQELRELIHRHCKK